MKKLYFRPPGLSRLELLAIAAVALIAMIGVETLPRESLQPNFREKMEAARLAESMMRAVREGKLERGIPIDPEVDPALTGMIGNTVTPITSNTGYIESKLTSTNPNFAAVIVHLLKHAKVEEGDVVAIGVSGSFPALNISTYAAVKALKLQPLIIASAASSEWGATDVNYLWLDMERTLFEQRHIAFRSIAASRGGVDDRGFGISRQGRQLLDEAIDRSGLPKLIPKDLNEAINQRMSLYQEHAGDRRISAYINVGGGSASVGTHIGKKLFNPGLNTTAPRGTVDSVMTRFVEAGVPVIHLTSVKELASRYGLAEAPREPQTIGQGRVFREVTYNPWLAASAIALILATMVALLRFDLGFRVFSRAQPKASRTPERGV